MAGRRSKRSQAPTEPLRPPLQVSTFAATDPTPHLVVQATGDVREDTMLELLEAIRQAVNAQGTSRVLMDLSTAEVHLTIADMNDLAKLVIANFAGVLDRVAVLMRPEFILKEKFFEPLLRNKGLPITVTPDRGEALYWLGARFTPLR